MSKNAINYDDLYVILSYIYKFKDCKPRLAMKKLLEIDVVKNNYTKTSLYNLFHCVKAYINDGNIRKLLSKTKIEILNKIHQEHEQEKPVYTENVSAPSEPLRITPEQELQKLKDQYEKLQEFRINKSHEYRQKQEELKKEFDLFMDTSGDMLDEMIRQI